MFDARVRLSQVREGKVRMKISDKLKSHLIRIMFSLATIVTVQQVVGSWIEIRTNRAEKLCYEKESRQFINISFNVISKRDPHRTEIEFESHYPTVFVTINGEENMMVWDSKKWLSYRKDNKGHVVIIDNDPSVQDESS